MVINQLDLKGFIEAIVPSKITMSYAEGINMTFNIEKFRENTELYYNIAEELADFSEKKGGNDLARHYRSIEPQSDMALQFICSNHLLFENIAKDYQAEMLMKSLQGQETLIHISDGSKWKFLHYKPINTGKNTVRADYKGDDFPPKDKNFVHVMAWDTEKNDWQEDSHEEFITSEFTKS